MGNPLDKARIAVSRMIPCGDLVLAAVSGGPDSVCLLHLLNDLKEAGGFTLSVAHFNHRTRGGESDADANFVQTLAGRLGLPIHIGSADVRRERADLKTSFQEAARILRSRFLESTRQRIGAHRLALGHTADDQAETLLMHLLRGSGLKGLGGMPEVRGAIVRPLIDCSREEILEYLRSRGLDWRTDSSNLAPDYLRNRIRLQLIPEMQRYNPKLRARLTETARILREDESFLTEHTETLFAQIARPLAGGQGVAFERGRFAKQHAAMQKRLLRRAVAGIAGSLRKIGAVHIEEALQLFAEAETAKRIHLPGGLTVFVDAQTITVEKNPAGAGRILTVTEPLEPVTLNIPGTTAWKEAGMEFQTRIAPAGERIAAQTLPGLACFDFETTGSSVLARTFQPGDRFVPLGMQGRKKVKSFFIDEKIPREFRRAIPILTTGTGDIIWIYGQRISERHRVTDRTRRVLWIKGVEISGL